MMAFGAGALLFAVTIELYAHALHELRHGKLMFFSEMCVILVGAITGAMFYLWINRHLEKYMLGEDDYETTSHSAAPPPQAAAAKAAASKPTPKAPASPPLSNKPATEKTPLTEKKEPATSSSSMPITRYAAKGGSGAPASKPAFSKISAAMGSAEKAEAGAAGVGVGASGAAQTPEEKKAALKLKAKAMWTKARVSVKFSNFVQLQAMRNVRGREKGMRHLMVEIQKMASKVGLDTPRSGSQMGKSQTQVEFESAERDEVVKRAKLVALQLFLGLLVDGVPEAILMGFLAARGHLTPVFIIALFFANFPEAFSSASLLTVAKLSWWGIVGMWTFLCLLVGVVAGISCWALLAMYPGYATGALLPTPVLIGIAAIEGLTGGSMIACIAAVMLPEAFERMGKEPPLLLSSGFMCACGFLTAVLLKATTD
jgi:zinc transporter ZupT